MRTLSIEVGSKNFPIDDQKEHQTKSITSKNIDRNWSSLNHFDWGIEIEFGNIYGKYLHSIMRLHSNEHDPCIC